MTLPGPSYNPDMSVLSLPQQTETRLGVVVRRRAVKKKEHRQIRTVELRPYCSVLCGCVDAGPARNSCSDTLPRYHGRKMAVQLTSEITAPEPVRSLKSSSVFG